jgi:hypothetical protein
MRIQWNRVTWYSKLLALGLFIALPIMAFWFGFGEGKLVGAAKLAVPAPTATVVPSSSADPTGAEYYGNVAEWQAYTDTQGAYTITYPIDFPTTQNYTDATTTDWKMLGDPIVGTLGFTLTIPASFEPQTNFAEAKLTVGWSGGNASVPECLAPYVGGGPNGAATSSATVNGVTFAVVRATGAGAGNFYETTSYRAMHGGQCYAIEYTIHSGQIANYPASYNLRPFDEKPLTDLLERVVGTFKFQ